jgi:hypothetical protein
MFRDNDPVLFISLKVAIVMPGCKSALGRCDGIEEEDEPEGEEQDAGFRTAR